MTTFAGYPLHTLADLPPGKRADLLHMLAADCDAAAHRHRTILANRAAAALVRQQVADTAELLGWQPVTPEHLRPAPTVCACGHPRTRHHGGHACTATGCTCTRMTSTARRTA